MKQGIKHLIECHCILPQYRNRESTVFHKFVVFSVLENNTVIPKPAQCNNCGAIHNILDVCKSEILLSRDESVAVITIEDIKISLPDKLSGILESYNCDVSTWEHAKFIIKEKSWGSKIRLNFDTSETETAAKFLVFNEKDDYEIIAEVGSTFLEKPDV
tara:strand:+ start:329 stop:805 length:477 start_codon:yes stop_codon:yes gene_type:complete